MSPDDSDPLPIPDLPHIPDFELPASSGRIVSFSSFRGQTPLVMLVSHDLRSALPVFRPFDNHLAEFGAEHAQVLGVATAELAEVQEFVAQHQLQLPVIADRSGTIARELDLEKLCRPVVLVADIQGGVREALVFPDVHVEGVLDMVRRVRAA